MTEMVRFDGYIPSALLFIQPTEQQVHLLVMVLVRMLSRLLAVQALTYTNS